MKKLVILMLVLSMLVSVLAACGDKKDPGPTEPTSTAGTPGGDVTPPAGETQPPKTYADVPKADLGDGTNPMKVNILTRGDGILWQSIDWDYEAEPDEGTDVISTAVYNRNLRVETDYNIAIKQIGKPDKELLSFAESAALAMEADYDLIVMPFTHQLGTMAVGGYYRDLANMSTIDINDPWWSHSTNDTLALFGYYFTLCGDINIIDDKATTCVLFNKYQIDQYELGNQFELVTENQWTWEKMYENAAVFAEEAHPEYGKGRYGIGTEYEMVYTYLATTGMMSVVQEDNALTDNTNARLFQEVMSVIYTKLENDNIQVFADSKTDSPDYDAVDFGGLYNIFKAGNVLYLQGTVSNVMSSQLADMENPIGILPFPKYASTQEKYISTVQSYNATGVSIPVNVSNEKAEALGTVLTAMSAASVTTLTPAFYSKLLEMDIVDRQSKQMMEMILENRVVDMGIVLSPQVRTVLTDTVKERDGYEYTSIRGDLWKSLQEGLKTITELGQNGFKAPEKAE